MIFGDFRTIQETWVDKSRAYAQLVHSGYYTIYITMPVRLRHGIANFWVPECAWGFAVRSSPHWVVVTRVDEFSHRHVVKGAFRLYNNRAIGCCGVVGHEISP